MSDDEVFFVDHERVEVTHFDRNEIDRLLVDNGDQKAAEELREIWEKEAKCSAGGEILLRLVELLLPTRISKITPQAVGLRVLVLAWMIGSQKSDIGSQSLADLAKRLKVTRAILSHWVRHYEEALGFHARGQKRSGAVESCTESAYVGWETRRSRKAAEDALDGVSD